MCRCGLDIQLSELMPHLGRVDVNDVNAILHVQRMPCSVAAWCLRVCTEGLKVSVDRLYGLGGQGGSDIRGLNSSCKSMDLWNFAALLVPTSRGVRSKRKNKNSLVRTGIIAITWTDPRTIQEHCMPHTSL